MHELAITERIVSVITEHVGSGRVARVVVEIGALAGVVPDALRFCFDVCTEGTALAGASLDLIEVRGRARCRACGGLVEVSDFVPLCICGGTDLQLLSGQELRVKEVEVR